MRIAKTILMALFGVAIWLPVSALEIKGIKLDEEQTVSSTVLSLNGAGVRKKFFVSVYVGALYLKEPASTTQQVLDAMPPKRVAMHILYDEISSEKLRNAWLDGFDANTTTEERAALAPRIEHFNTLFPAVKEGDRLTIDCLADALSVSLNGDILGTVDGADFCRPVLNIWLGEKPASRGLKKAMLGGS